MQKSFGKISKTFRNSFTLLHISLSPFVKRLFWWGRAAPVRSSFIARQKFSPCIPRTPQLTVNFVRKKQEIFEVFLKISMQFRFRWRRGECRIGPADDAGEVD